MARRVSRAHNKELAGFPVGQIVGRMDRIRPTQEVVLELVEDCITTVERMCRRLARESGYRVATIDTVLWRACEQGILNSLRYEAQGWRAAFQSPETPQQQ